MKPKPANKIGHAYLLCFLSITFFLVGCASYTVTTNRNDKADVQPKTQVLTSYLWGALNRPKIGVVDTTCGTAGLERVVISTNFGYTLLQIVTLGVVNKVKVQYMCQKQEPEVGYKP